MDNFTLTLGGTSQTLSFDTRDWSLMDGTNPFAQKGASFRRYISDAATSSIVSGHYRGHCYERCADYMLVYAKQFIAEMEASTDLLAHNYSFRFTEPPSWAEGTGGRGLSGFKVNGLNGSVWRKRGGTFVLVELLQVGPNDVGRVVQYLDMRAVGELETDDWGTLKITRRKARFDTLEKLNGLLAFIRENVDINEHPQSKITIDTRDHGSAA